MIRLLVVLTCCAAGLLVTLTPAYGYDVTDQFVHGYFTSQSDMLDPTVEGTTGTLLTTDTSQIFYRMGATLTWTALETTPEQMWYALYEDDTNPDDLVGAGIISSTINYPLAGWIITWQ